MSSVSSLIKTGGLYGLLQLISENGKIPSSEPSCFLCTRPWQTTAEYFPTPPLASLGGTCFCMDSLLCSTYIHYITRGVCYKQGLKKSHSKHAIYINYYVHLELHKSSWVHSTVPYFLGISHYFAFKYIEEWSKEFPFL